MYDYGNGDHLGAEANGDRCRLWWIGHDPYFLVYWGESIVELLEAAATALENEEEVGFEPVATAAVGLGDRPPDARLQAWLETLPSSAVLIDLRQAATGTQVDVVGLPPGCVRLGRVLAFSELDAPDTKSKTASLRSIADVRARTGSIPSKDLATLAHFPEWWLVVHESEADGFGEIETASLPDHDTSWRPPWYVFMLDRPVGGPSAARKWWQFWR